jgi:hypothetical protein
MMFRLAASHAPNFKALPDAAVTDMEDPAKSVVQDAKDPIQLLRTISSTLTSHFGYTTMPDAVEDVLACRKLFDAFHLRIAVSGGQSRRIMSPSELFPCLW